jgi:hypothetical protein
VTLMENFISWVVAELEQYALFSFLARFSRTQWTIFITVLILLIIAVTGEWTWTIAAAVLFGAFALWVLLFLVDLAFNKMMRHQ